MHVCLCNNFNSQTIDDNIDALKSAGRDQVDFKEFYNMCSGGADGQCKKCFKDITKSLKANEIAIVRVP